MPSKPIESAFRKRTRSQLFIVVTFLFFGIPSIVVFFMYGPRKQAEIFVPSFLMLLGGVGALIHYLRIKNPENTALGKLLMQNPTQIVWLFIKNDLIVAIGTEGGKLHELEYEDEDFENGLNNLYEALKAIAPQATYGYSAENHETFQQDPKRLRKASKE